MKFITENGIKVPAVTAEQMKEIDRIAIEETGPNLFQMMENAGRNLAELTMKVIRSDFKQEILVLAGKGGNSSGGICAARHLANRGYQVKVCITEPEKLKDVSKYQLHISKSTNAEIISIEELQKENPDLIIDAIIGYSLTGELKGSALELIKWAESKLCIKISIDVPSGVDATTGKTYCDFIKPDLTMTLALPKTGLLPELTGELYLADIGIPPNIFSKINLQYLIETFKNGYIVPLRANNNAH
ncbi:MAG: NAD(P)H-hydrate epimerase [Melioribacter sp.]|nr:NAD(P)H-hydrate epimerase [Melioribacter sp.]